jgi:hypothetical protein
VIVAIYEFILEKFEGSADSREALQDSRSAAQDLLRLLESLVDASRLEGGHFEREAADRERPPPHPPLGGSERALMSKIKTSPPVAIDGRFPVWLQDSVLSEHEKAAYREAADRLGLEVGHWARHVLNQAARYVVAVPRSETRRAPGALPGVKRRSGRARRRRPPRAARQKLARP